MTRKPQRIEMPREFETEYRERAAKRTLETGETVSRNDIFVEALTSGLKAELPGTMPAYLENRGIRKSITVRMPEPFLTAYRTLAAEAQRKWGAKVHRSDMFVWALTEYTLGPE